MSDTWQDIDTYQKDLWDGETVWLRDEAGNEKIGVWKYEDESWDEIWGAWHDDKGDYLGFEPTHWKKV